jgi:hypothetical protein
VCVGTEKLSFTATHVKRESTAECGFRAVLGTENDGLEIRLFSFTAEFLW